jgi:type II secretion system protein H
MLVVIVLAGILISIVTINLTPDPRQQLQREAQRVGQLMALAADESRIRQMPIIWEADLRGYRFVSEVAGERKLMTDDDSCANARQPPLACRTRRRRSQPAQVLLGPGHRQCESRSRAMVAAALATRADDRRRLGPRHQQTGRAQLATDRYDAGSRCSKC